LGSHLRRRSSFYKLDVNTRGKYNYGYVADNLDLVDVAGCTRETKTA
jgi:hypothetical protein